MSFAYLGLSENICNTINDVGYVEPTAIQQQVIPIILQGSDLMAITQTGTGKTAGFALPLLEKILCTPKKLNPKQIRVLVITPTRELAFQIYNEINLYAHAFGVSSAYMFGGSALEEQFNTIQNGVDILIACPGRLLDLVRQNSIDLSQVDCLVLDELDRMLDMGFLPKVQEITQNMPQTRQNLFFSATTNEKVDELAQSLLNSAQIVQLYNLSDQLQQVNQQVYHVITANKRKLLLHLLNDNNYQQILIFMRTKARVKRLLDFLTDNDIKAKELHSSRNQDERSEALNAFKTGEARILIATDLVARGIDIEGLPLVINFDLPSVPADYVHRVSRAGSSDNVGTVISLVCAEEEKLLRAIESFIKQSIPVLDTPDFLTVANQAVDSNADNIKKKGTGIYRRKRTIKPKPKEGYNSLIAQDNLSDEELDNIGNRIDYVSPYQNSGNEIKKPKNIRKPKPKTNSSKPEVKSKKRTTKPAGAVNGNAKPYARKKGYRSLMSDAPLKEVGSARVLKNDKARTPIILRKSSSVLTKEQLSSLQQHLSK